MPNNHLKAPPTPEGAKLNLTAEEEETYKVVYKKSEKPGEPAFFAGFWNPETDYDDDHIIVPFTSVYGGITNLADSRFQQGKEFANIIGSTKDPKPTGYSAWIELYRDKLKLPATSCCSDGGFYNPDNDTKDPDLTCSRDIKGGHIMPGKANEAVSKGNEVYILPICGTHNTHKIPSTAKTGTVFYMKLLQPTRAVILKSYLEIGLKTGI